MLNFKDKLYAKAFKVSIYLYLYKVKFSFVTWYISNIERQTVHKPGRDGIKLLALKFVEAIILLFTPDPNGSSEPPPHQTFGGSMNFKLFLELLI